MVESDAAQASSMGWVLHARAAQYEWAGTGSASIKSFSGPAEYELEPGRVVVDPNHYLLLNDGEPYRIAIPPRAGGASAAVVESFCVFFPPGALARARGAAHADPASLLDGPQESPLTLLNHPRRHDRVVSPLLRVMHHQYAARRLEGLGLDESLARLMNAIVRVHDHTEHRMAHLGGARASTRRELLRRVLVARDYVQAHYAEPMTLEALSRAAALSPNRVIQHYREAFGATPYQEVRQLRLKAAYRRLRQGHSSVTEVALEVGWDTPAAFSTAFKAAYGQSPRQVLHEGKSGDFEQDRSFGRWYGPSGPSHPSNDVEKE